MKRKTHSKYRSVVQIGCYVTPAQRDQLRNLSAKSRTPAQVFLREALDDLFIKHGVR